MMATMFRAKNNVKKSVSNARATFCHVTSFSGSNSTSGSGVWLGSGISSVSYTGDVIILGGVPISRSPTPTCLFMFPGTGVADRMSSPAPADFWFTVLTGGLLKYSSGATLFLAPNTSANFRLVLAQLVARLSSIVTISISVFDEDFQQGRQPDFSESLSSCSMNVFWFLLLPVARLLAPGFSESILHKRPQEEWNGYVVAHVVHAELNDGDEDDDCAQDALEEKVSTHYRDGVHPLRHNLRHDEEEHGERQEEDHRVPALLPAVAWQRKHKRVQHGKKNDRGASLDANHVTGARPCDQLYVAGLRVKRKVVHKLVTETADRIKGVGEGEVGLPDGVLRDLEGSETAIVRRRPGHEGVGPGNGHIGRGGHHLFHLVHSIDRHQYLTGVLDGSNPRSVGRRVEFGVHQSAHIVLRGASYIQYTVDLKVISFVENLSDKDLADLSRQLLESLEFDRLLNQAVSGKINEYSVVVLPATGPLTAPRPTLGVHRAMFLTFKGKGSLATTIAGLVKASLVREQTVQKRFNTARGARKNLKPDKEMMRSVKFSAGYDVTLTLISPQPDILDVQWEAEQGIQAYLDPMIKRLSNYSKIVIKSQVLYFTKLHTRPTKEGGEYFFSREKLPHVINPLEAKLGQRLPSNAFLSPQWGGIYIYNVPHPQENATLPAPHTLDMGRIMESSTDLDVLPVGVDALRDWEIDGWLRSRCVENLATSSASLTSLSQLLGKISNIVINDNIGEEVKTAVLAMQEALEDLQQGNLELAYLKSRNAIRASGLPYTFHCFCRSVFPCLRLCGRRYSGGGDGTSVNRSDVMKDSEQTCRNSRE
ncbi:LOW QUALITY PROTEIN: PIGS-like protein [Mya arenaria]|uniref:PIGS-like protein n=1 Tax=Mya arenaria TaxID=6604 RepID=A0ABY7FFG4_MYAAR|nr:LOW QUALITY PROTEIN: PIGS-like protein [Mya arenaria]